MPLHITLALLALLHATRIFAQSCPPDSPSFSVTNSTYDGDIVQDLCRESPITVTGGGSCEVLTRRSNGAAGPDTFTYLCSFSSYGTISIAANTFVRRTELQLLGGLGGTLEYAHLGGQPKKYYLEMVGPRGTTSQATSYAVWVNSNDRSTYSSPSQFAIGGGGYSAIGDAACAAEAGSDVFPLEDGRDCRWFTAGGGGGASYQADGAGDDEDGVQGNSAQPITSGTQPDSRGGMPFVNREGYLNAGGGGAGWRGGAASTDDLVDGQVRATASGAGGSSGGDAEFASLYRVVNQGLDADRGPAQVFFQIYTIGSPCEHLSDTVETVSTTTTVEQTNFVETVYTPSATVTESPTTTVTATPEAVTETEYPETTTITLPAETFTEEMNGGATTPATSTIYISTDVTNTPATATFTSTTTPAASTAYVTSTSTIIPPVSTYTAVKSVVTGSAACTTYRLVYPAACCPNTYLNTYLKLTARPAARQRRARSFGKTRHDFAKRAVVTVTETQTQTRTVNATRTLTGDEVTVTETVTTTEELPTPTSTVFETQTAFRDQPQVVVTATYYDEAATPLLYETSTSTHEAPTPTQTISETAAASTTTLAVYTNTTLVQQTITTTSTVYSQATNCASKAVGTQAVCPLPLLRGADRIAQVATINSWKLRAANQPLIIDCGTAGVWTYDTNQLVPTAL